MLSPIYFCTNEDLNTWFIAPAACITFVISDYMTFLSSCDIMQTSYLFHCFVIVGNFGHSRVYYLLCITANLQFWL